jgi:hypothetical protein
MVPGPHRACAFDKACRSNYIRTCMKELFPLRVFRRGGIVLAARAKCFRQSGRKAVKHSEYNTFFYSLTIFERAIHFKITVFYLFIYLIFIKKTITGYLVVVFFRKLAPSLNALLCALLVNYQH